MPTFDTIRACDILLRVILYFEASGLLLCSQSYTNDIIQELLKSLLNTLNVTDPQLPRQLE